MLADRNRLKILNILLRAGGQAVCVCEFTDQLDLAQPTVSYHLKQLREAGLLDREKRGTFAYFRVRAGGDGAAALAGRAGRAGQELMPARSTDPPSITDGGGDAGSSHWPAVRARSTPRASPPATPRSRLNRPSWEDFRAGHLPDHQLVAHDER